MKAQHIDFNTRLAAFINDYDQTATPMFHQMELIIDNISFTNPKGTLQ